MNVLGFYKEFRGEKFPSLKEVVSIDEREIPIDSRILNYLNEGIWLNSLRTIFECPIFYESISGLKGPSIYTDGEWFWTSEYIFYLEKFSIIIPETFFDKMEKNQYVIPDKKVLENDSNKLILLEEKINNYWWG